MKIESTLIDLFVEGEHSLVIHLYEDGTIHRKGYGNNMFPDDDLYIGHIDPEIFNDYVSSIDSEFLTNSGIYQSPKKAGKTCFLSFIINTSEGTFPFKYDYGSESEGPHKEIAMLVQKAIDITESWYAMQRNNMVQSESKKDDADA